MSNTGHRYISRERDGGFHVNLGRRPELNGRQLANRFMGPGAEARAIAWRDDTLAGLISPTRGTFASYVPRPDNDDHGAPRSAPRASRPAHDHHGEQLRAAGLDVAGLPPFEFKPDTASPRELAAAIGIAVVAARRGRPLTIVMADPPTEFIDDAMSVGVAVESASEFLATHAYSCGSNYCDDPACTFDHPEVL